MERVVRALLLLAGYPLAFHLAYVAASLFWHPPAGVRFAAFVLLPPRWWLPLVLASELFGWWLDPQLWAQSFRGWPWFFAFFLAAAAGPWLLRKRRFAGIEGMDSIGWLLGAMLLSALGESLVNLAWPFRNAVEVVDTVGIPQGWLFLQLLLGDYLGMLILVPVVLLGVRQWPQIAHWHSWRIDLLLVLLPVLGVAAWFLADAGDYRAYLFVTGMCLIPVTYMAFRSGWRGAALGLTAVSSLVALSGWASGQAQATVESQLFIAAAGSAVLVLGVAIEALRSSEVALLQRNMALAAGNARLDELTTQLRDTARRNLTMSEDLRRWITAELHDELGQSLTALQVRIKLAGQAMAQPEALAPVRDIVATMRHSVSGLLADLRPAGLDEFGLVRALREGALRETVESSGVDYRLRIDGDPGLLERLDNDGQTALYRVVQEAATNTLRHAGANEFRVVLRIRAAGSRLHVVLMCADDGSGILPSEHPAGIGLQGIADRVRSFDGRLRMRSGTDGARIVVAMAFGEADEDG